MTTNPARLLGLDQTPAIPNLDPSVLKKLAFYVILSQHIDKATKDFTKWRKRALKNFGALSLPDSDQALLSQSIRDIFSSLCIAKFCLCRQSFSSMSGQGFLILGVFQD